ncbi:MAG: sigma-54-dependent Fis family transcriptional regulator [Candidatus Schekmanbacteria bacterium]|nr:sigma-54-dependent Fis family transcriptional regulator [Candidatus Schekmanbacteria bacterium]
MDNSDIKILLIDDDDSLRRVIEHNLCEEGYKVISASGGSAGIKILMESEFDIVITDLKMPDIDGMEVLGTVKSHNKDIPVIMITAFGTIEQAVAALKSGAFDYLTKPFNRDELKITVKKALELRSLRGENLRLKAELSGKFSFDSLIYGSPVMNDIVELLRKVSYSDSTVMLLGESGTGKELIAKAIHYNSPRNKGPFVIVNCAAIPDELLESELFGHSKGAFTGAYSEKKGKFEYADSGTIFLDEIGDLKPSLQAKLLRVLQEKKIDKVGSSVQVDVDVRIISATNRDLKKMISDSLFREDLFYRLSVIPVRIPPLRERRDDIPLLLDYFIKKNSKQRKLVVTSEALAILTNYSWRGNVRELENLIERLTVIKSDSTIIPADLPEEMTSCSSVAGGVICALPEEGLSLDELERDIILKALEKNEWNQSKAAKYLDMTRPTLIYRMEKYNIKKP